MKKIDRIFTFGCSYTKFCWPTWADIISYDLKEIPLQNFGRSGAGNEYIFMKMIECNLKYTFTKNDLILVNWSSWHREDRIDKNGDWRTGGNIFNSIDFDKTFLKKYHSLHNDLVKNSNWIIAANNMFNIDFQSHMVDYETTVEYKDVNQVHTYLKEYQYLKDAMPKKIIFDITCNSHFNGTANDKHPDVLCHLTHVQTIYNTLGFKLLPETNEKVQGIHADIKDLFKKCMSQQQEHDACLEYRRQTGY